MRPDYNRQKGFNQKFQRKIFFFKGRGIGARGKLQCQLCAKISHIESICCYIAGNLMGNFFNSIGNSFKPFPSFNQMPSPTANMTYYSGYIFGIPNYPLSVLLFGGYNVQSAKENVFSPPFLMVVIPLLLNPLVHQIKPL